MIDQLLLSLQEQEVLSAGGKQPDHQNRHGRRLRLLQLHGVQQEPEHHGTGGTQRPR